MIRITFAGCSEPIISDELWQYDYGQKVRHARRVLRVTVKASVLRSG